MKPQFHKIPLLTHNSYIVRQDNTPQLGSSFHYHPEMELVYIIKGCGTRYIGNNISSFSEGEIILLGENLPHSWRYKEMTVKGESFFNAESLVIHFRPDCLGKDLLSLPEAYLLPRLFEKAKAGLLLSGKTREKVAKLMRAVPKSSNLERIILLLSILKIIAECSELTSISSQPESLQNKNEYDKERLNEICTYTLSNYKKEISLEEISSISHLSVTSFCRYFKSMTKKTYYNFLNEIRVGQACKLLIEDRFPTNIICYECGFNNISNFYRHFKKITGITPYEYKKKYLSC
ncbi:AraC family transcriptional regulator [Arachidicoccus sp.]|uniref:AraC family transcriptional regulator n=1 Tax=Arachidicoccus sp. TaxID=1872624 RepID=UPI003D1CDB1C